MAKMAGFWSSLLYFGKLLLFILFSHSIIQQIFIESWEPQPTTELGDTIGSKNSKFFIRLDQILHPLIFYLLLSLLPSGATEKWLISVPHLKMVSQLLVWLRFFSSGFPCKDSTWVSYLILSDDLKVMQKVGLNYLLSLSFPFSEIRIIISNRWLKVRVIMVLVWHRISIFNCTHICSGYSSKCSSFTVIIVLWGVLMIPILQIRKWRHRELQ